MQKGMDYNAKLMYEICFCLLDDFIIRKNIFAYSPPSLPKQWSPHYIVHKFS